MAANACIRLRDDLSDLQPYDPGLCVQEVVVSANESPYGVPEPVRDAALAAVAATAFERYPDPLADELRDAIAAWHGVDRSRVVVGNGGDELIFDLLLAFGGEGRTLLDCPPTFSIYALYAQLTRTNVVAVPRDPSDFALDCEAIEAAAAQADIVMITSPNNPTGNVADPAWIERLAQKTRGLVVVDEAYIEFADEGASCASLLERCDNIAILRTFSKAFGLAGVRTGYLLAPSCVVDGIAAVRQPYSVNAVSQAIARTVVAHRDAYAPTLETIRCERARLAAALAAIDGVDVWPSSANFLLVRLPDAHDAYVALRDDYSILVRDFSRTPLLENCLRITVGLPEENDRVIAAVADIRKERA